MDEHVENLTFDVHQPPASRATTSFFNLSGHDLQPYTIEVTSSKGVWRVHRNYESLVVFNETIKGILGKELTGFPAKKRFFGGIFKGSFADSDSGEQRRLDLAKYINSAYQVCKEHNSAREKFVEFFGYKALFEAIEKGEIEKIQSLLQSGQQSVFDYEEANQYSCLHFLSLQSRTNSEVNSKAIAEVLLQYGADIFQPDLHFRSPFLLSLLGPSPNNKEKWEEYVLFLIDSGSDLLEQTKEGDSVLHLVLEYSNIVEKITTSLSRIKDKYNSDGNTAYTLAIQREFKSTETILRAMGARTNADIQLIEKTLDTEVKQFDGFLDLAQERNDSTEIVAILIRLADLQLLEQPITSVKILNCTLLFAFENQLNQDEIYQKLFQAYHRIGSMYEYSINLQDTVKTTDNLRKYRRRLQETRSNLNHNFTNKQTQQALKWLSERFLLSFKDVIDESLSLIPPAPCPYAILSLGPLALNESPPSYHLQFAILIETTGFQTLEYFRMLVKVLELNVINLQETEYKIFNYRTKSPTISGLQFDYVENIPLLVSEFGPFSLLATPYQLALLQEQLFFKENANLSLSLWEAGFVSGEKRLYDTYRLEMDRILNRKNNISTRTLRQNRATALLRTEVKEFVPKMNRDIDAESRFELRRNMCLFPSRVITLLCLYYNINPFNLNTWDRIDKIQAAGYFSKDSANNLKKAITSITELYIRSGERKVVEIKTAIEEYNKAHPCDDDDEKTTLPEEPIAESEEEKPKFETLEVDGDEEEQVPTQNENFQLYKLTTSDVEQIAQGYLVLLPLHNALKEWLYWESKDTKKANDILKNSPFYDGSNTTFAEAYFRLCHYEKAKYYFKAAIEQDSSNSKSLNLFGVMWNKLGNYANAIKYYEKAVTIIEGRGKDAASELATQYNNLAMANINLKNPLEAIKWLEKALKMDETVYGEKHPYVAQDYHNIGLLAKQEGQFDKALSNIQQALDIDEGHYGRISLQVATDLNDLGKVYQSATRLSESMESYEAALSIYKQIYSDHHPTVASLFISIATIYRSLEDKPNSILYYEKSLEIHTKILGDEHYTVATSLYECALLYADIDQLEKSLNYLQISYAAYKKLSGENKKDTQTVYRKMKEVEFRLKQKLTLSPEEYEEWKRKMAELRKTKTEEEFVGMLIMETEEGEKEEEEFKPTKIFSSGKIGTWKGSVFEDEFYDL